MQILEVVAKIQMRGPDEGVTSCAVFRKAGGIRLAPINSAGRWG